MYTEQLLWEIIVQKAEGHAEEKCLANHEIEACFLKESPSILEILNAYCYYLLKAFLKHCDSSTPLHECLYHHHCSLMKVS